MHHPTWDTPERLALRETVDRFATAEVVPHLAVWEENGRLPRELHRRTADAGLLGIGFPEQVGGQGGSPIDV